MATYMHLQIGENQIDPKSSFTHIDAPKIFIDGSNRSDFGRIGKFENVTTATTGICPVLQTVVKDFCSF